MRKRKGANITQIAVVAIVVSTAIVSCAIALLNFTLNKNAEIARIQSDLAHDADKLATSLEMPIWDLDTTQITILLENELENTNIVGVALKGSLSDMAFCRTRDGSVIATTAFPTDSLYSEKRIIFHANDQIGELELYSSPATAIARLRQNFDSFLIVIVILEVLLVSMLYIYLRRYILKPVQELEQYVSVLSASARERFPKMEWKAHYAGELESFRRSLEKTATLLEEQYYNLQHAIKELSESQDFLNGVLQNIPDMIYVKDAKKLVYVNVNRTVEELLGFSSDEFLEKDDFSLFPKEQADFYLKCDLEAIASGLMVEIPEETIQTKAKGELILHTRKIRIDDREGNAKYVLGISNDITDKVLAERKLRELDQDLERRVDDRTKLLQNLNADLERFSYSISHDLSAPLRSISSYTQILLDEYKDALDVEGKRRLTIIINGAQRMDRVIQGLLSLARYSKEQLSISNLDMTKIAHEICEERLSTTEDAKDFAIEIDPLPHVQADESLIRQVMGQIIDNAIKFSASAAKKRIHIFGSKKEGYSSYSVQDDGLGFPPEFSENLFKAFESLNNRKEFDGIGVGLAIARTIVERHGGTITAESSLGNGATFTFTIPDQRISARNERKNPR